MAVDTGSGSGFGSGVSTGSGSTAGAGSGCSSTTAICGGSFGPNWRNAASAAGMAITSTAPAQARPLVIRRSICIEKVFQQAPPERGDIAPFHGHNMKGQFATSLNPVA
ncbi:hypothetical protein C4375_14610 [Devosia sp. I507]|nr:hypothetical protein C4375_14610 [Devosia sp. I507]